MILIPNIYKKIAKNLRLDQPLVIFDTETTGLNLHSDRIVELAYIKIWPSGRLKKDGMLFNPEMKISDEAIAVHGIDSSFVKDKPKFREKAQELWEVFYDCYYSGFNTINFDLPLLRREFIRCGFDLAYSAKRVIDTKEVFRKMVPRSLSSAYQYYTGKEFKQWHAAMVDAEAAAEILSKQLDKYQECRDWEFINKLHQAEEDSQADGSSKFYWLHGQAYFAFSKYRDKTLSQVARDDPAFLRWIMEAEFSDEVKNVVGKALEEAAGRSAKPQ